MMLPTVIRGFSEAYGSWKIICMRRRIFRISSPPSLVSSTPSNFTSPAVGLYSWRIARPVVDLPHPDSPPRPSVSLFSTEKHIPPRPAQEAERLALLDEEIDPVYRAYRADLALEDDPLRKREVHLQRFDVEEVLAAVDGCRAPDPDVVRVGRLRRCVQGHLCTS